MLMKNVFQLSIPKPCHENWDNFTPTSTGGFCASCQKNVQDFSQMSDIELIAFFRNAAATKNSSLCGRFRENQLQKYYDINQWFPEWIIEENQVSCEISVEELRGKRIKIQLPNILLKTSLAAMMVLSLSVNAQHKTVSGKITDAEDGLGLPGVSIQIVGTKKGTTSNEKGEYSIEVDGKQKLRFSFVGYEAQEIEAKNIKNISLKTDATALGGLVVVGYTNRMGRYVTGGISTVNSFCPSQSFPEEVKIPQPIKLSLYPNIAQENEVFLKPEALETEKGTEKTAFGEIENLEVYDYYSGKNFKVSYKKEENGELKLNITKVPNGLYVVRLLQKNSLDAEKPIVSIARLVVER